MMYANIISMLLNNGNIQAALLFVLVLVLYWRMSTSDNNRLNLPPGPKGWPLVGSLFSLGFHSERYMMELNRKYGPVCKVRMPKRTFIILGSMEAVNEAFVKQGDIFSDRVQNSVNGLSGDGGIIFIQYGKLLKEQKRFCISTLKDFGMGRQGIEPDILELCSEVHEELDRKCEKNESFGIETIIYFTITGVISKLVFRKNLSKESKGFRDFINIMIHGVKNNVLNSFIIFFPKLKAIPPFRKVANVLLTHEANLMRTFQDEIDDHKRTRDPNHPRDLVDCYLNEIDKSKVDGKETGFNDEQFKLVVRDIVLAGSDTTASTLRWIFLYLCKNPDAQERVHREIDQVLGHSKPPSMSFLDEMPYTRAVIQETMRLRPLGPLALPHFAKAAGTVMGYDIPKGSVLVANLFGIQHDEKMWPDADKFDPTRHLDSSGKFVKSQSIIPFSLGPRQCPGILLANMENFLILVSILQKFSFSLVDGENIDMRGKNTLSLKPYPYKVTVSRR